MSAEDHAPVGAMVEIVTEGFEEAGHVFRIGERGVVLGVGVWAAVSRVGDRRAQFLRACDYREVTA